MQPTKHSLNVTKISLPPLPAKPLPIKLSVFDSIWIGFPPIQRLMLYSNPKTDFSFPSLLEFLTSSLSATLFVYLPLARKLTYVPSTGDVEIDFSDPHVTFIEAESDLDLHQLVTSEIHDVESFIKLVPAIDVSFLPFSVFTVQVTRFNCGGIAVGYSVHHSIIDGKAMLQFIEAWSSTCKNKMNGADDLPIEHRKPLYDRAVIKHTKGEEISREFLRSMALALPTTQTSTEGKRLHLIRRTFTLDAPSIQSLKQQATQNHESNDSTSRLPSTFSAISAHVWACIARSKSFDPNEETVLYFLTDSRAWLNPSIIDDYFGNCIRGVFARISTGELIGEDDLMKACAAIRKSVSEIPKDAISDCENWIPEFQAIPFERLVNVTAYPRFRVYEANFGWGRPDRFESVSMNRDGEFALVGGKEEGTVQVSVSLGPTQMETFGE